MAIVGWFCDYRCGFLDDTNTVEEELIPSSGVLLHYLIPLRPVDLGMFALDL